MQKQPNIRWRKRDSELLRQEINRFNSRLYYQQKKNPYANWLPERANVSKAVEGIQTRADFNRFISSLRQFNAETAKKVPREGRKATTVWAEKQKDTKEQRLRKQALANKEAANKHREQLAKEIGEMEVYQGTKPTGIKRAEMGSIKENAVKPLTQDIESMNETQLQKFIERTDRMLDANVEQRKKELWQRNYIKGLIREGYPPDIIELIKEIEPDDFAKIVDTNEYATIKFIYDPKELETRAKQIRETWLMYAQKRRSTWLDSYLSTHSDLAEKLTKKDREEFLNTTRDHIITNDNVIDLQMAYQEAGYAFNPDVTRIRAEIAQEATQGYFGRHQEEIDREEKRRRERQGK